MTKSEKDKWILIRCGQSEQIISIKMPSKKRFFRVMSKVGKNGPSAEKRALRTYSNSKNPDQPAQPRSLVRIFSVRLHITGGNKTGKFSFGVLLISINHFDVRVSFEQF